MERIPQEGAWFAPSFRSAEILGPEALPARYTGPRFAYNAIYGVQTRDDFAGQGSRPEPDRVRESGSARQPTGDPTGMHDARAMGRT
eukprot:gene68238-93496_t